MNKGKVIVWIAYGDIEVYAIQTEDQLKKLIDEVRYVLPRGDAWSNIQSKFDENVKDLYTLLSFMKTEKIEFLDQYDVFKLVDLINSDL